MRIGCRTLPLQATENVISTFAQKNLEIDILVLCGHTHSNAFIKLFKNLKIKAGSAKYYHPKLQEVILL